MGDTVICLYLDRHGELSTKYLKKVKEKPATSGYFYITGFLVAEGAYRVLRSDRVLKYFDTVYEAEVELKKLVESDNYKKEVMSSLTRANKDNKYSVSNLERLDVCFTGFKKQDRAELEQLAKDNDLNISKSVTVFLNILCCGYNAGATKVKKAEDQGVWIFDVYQFKNFIETGEIPNNI